MKEIVRNGKSKTSRVNYLYPIVSLTEKKVRKYNLKSFKLNVHHKYDIGLKCPNNIPVHQYKIHFSKFMPESIPDNNVYSLLSSLASCAQLFGL